MEVFPLKPFKDFKSLSFKNIFKDNRLYIFKRISLKIYSGFVNTKPIGESIEI